MAKKTRNSLYLRLQMNEGSPLDEIKEWLDSLDPREKNRRVEDVLIMCLLTYARLEREDIKKEKLIRTLLECNDTMEKHFSTLRQILELPPPKDMGNGENISIASHDSIPEEAAPVENEPCLGNVKVSVLKNLFG